jgi:1-acyl-sn-glycerol-3-phosphate acyltransferase
MWVLVTVAVLAALLLLRWHRRLGSFFDGFAYDLTRLYAAFWHRWSSNGMVLLPEQGPAILIANHTCSSDPMFLVPGCRRLLSFLVAQEHCDIHPLARWLLQRIRCVPVRRDGRDPIALRTALRRLQEGRVVCLFPEGNLSGVAKNRLLPAKQGVALLALRSRAPVFPCYIAGGPRTEHLLRAWLSPSPTPVHVTFGKAVDLSAYHDRPIDRKLLAEVTELLMQHVKDLQPQRDRKRTSKTSPQRR